MSSSDNAVLVDKRDDHVAIVTLNRPEARNAINAALTTEFEAAVRDVEADADVWVVVLTGAGQIAFSSGADLKEVTDGNLMKIIGGPYGLAGFVHAPRSKPWIAAVEGMALAGGCELALACDLIVASEGGFFGLPEVTRGLIASAGGVYRLPRAIPRAIAIECILTANRLSAERAYEFGMVNRLVPKGQALTVAIALASQIACNAPIAVRESLAIARAALDLDDASLRKLSDEAQERVISTEDFADGPRAFVEKRSPIWKGR
ncbi:MAG TPA: enoyl-CoA hydratase-related protein [Sphingomicrobium sp.]|nr:enoyl-CoA hydratase-related protein [Sphingomicrobium sp.]